MVNAVINMLESHIETIKFIWHFYKHGVQMVVKAKENQIRSFKEQYIVVLVKIIGKIWIIGK